MSRTAMLDAHSHRAGAIGATAVRIVTGTVVALVSAVGVAGPALAAPPERSAFTDKQTFVVSDLCEFDVTVSAVFPDTRKVDFYDNDGVLRRTTYHIVEQDSFTANGKTLQGLPYRFNSVLNFDEAGNITSAYATGLVVRVPLPDGSVFRAAGRVDFLQQIDDFVSVPDSGSSQNADAFCAALAP